MTEILVRLQKEIFALPDKKNLVSVVIYGSAASEGPANDIDIVVVVEKADSSLKDFFDLIGRYSKNLDFNVYTRKEVISGISYFAREFKLEYLAKGLCLFGSNILAEEYKKVDAFRYRQSTLIRLIEYLQMIRQKFYNPFVNEQEKIAYLHKYFWRISKNLLLFKGIGDHTYVNQLTNDEILEQLVKTSLFDRAPQINEDMDPIGYFRFFEPISEALIKCKNQFEAQAVPGGNAGSGSKYFHYLNGRYVTEDKLLVSPRDLGFSRGYGVFDYLRTYKGRPFKLKEHLARFLRSAQAIELKHDYTLEQLIQIVGSVLSVNDDGDEKQLRVMMSGGPSTSMRQESKPTLIVIVDKFKPKKREIYSGVKLDPVRFLRYKPESKNTNYIEGIIQQTKGDKEKFYEPLYYSDEQVYESSNSNIFAVKGEKIYTPQTNVFCGGTRGVLVHDLRGELHIVEKDFDLEFLLNADEVFISSSGKEIVPVIQIGERMIGDGKPGKTTNIVRKKFRDYVSSGSW